MERPETNSEDLNPANNESPDSLIDLSLINDSSAESITENDKGKAKAELEEYFKKPGEKEDHIRREKLKDAFALIARCILTGLALIVILIIVFRAYHLLVPCYMQWLSEDQINKIDQLFNYLIVGSIGSSLFKYFQSNIGLQE